MWVNDRPLDDGYKSMVYQRIIPKAERLSEK